MGLNFIHSDNGREIMSNNIVADLDDDMCVSHQFVEVVQNLRTRETLQKNNDAYEYDLINSNSLDNNGQK